MCDVFVIIDYLTTRKQLARIWINNFHFKMIHYRAHSAHLKIIKQNLEEEKEN